MHQGLDLVLDNLFINILHIGRILIRKKKEKNLDLDLCIICCPRSIMPEYAWF